MAVDYASYSGLCNVYLLGIAMGATTVVMSKVSFILLEILRDAGTAY